MGWGKEGSERVFLGGCGLRVCEGNLGCIGDGGG